MLVIKLLLDIFFMRKLFELSYDSSLYPISTQYSISRNNVYFHLLLPPQIGTISAATFTGWMICPIIIISATLTRTVVCDYKRFKVVEVFFGCRAVLAECFLLESVGITVTEFFNLLCDSFHFLILSLFASLIM